MALRCLSQKWRSLGCSGDPVELNSECFRRVDMLQVHRHRMSSRLASRVPMTAGAGDRTSAVASGVRCQAVDVECRVGEVGSGRFPIKGTSQV
ncbi:hypothetical protein TIFTF001_028799 [Ficus carica]|uniref:Uncharacterized protein n=1 Tax=Ficus carica TaxID=3494 RepID=A0AA88J2G8_FICCA|nr:hypothetical protein TIFTF001_028799 [Ficus carica]